MKTIYRSNLFILSFSLMIFLFVITGCSPVKINKVDIQNTDSYKFTTQNEGLRISADPYREENRLVEYFGCDLLSRGILPVLVVIENLSAEDGYMLLKEESRLLMKNAYAPTIEKNLEEGGYRSDELKKAVNVQSATNTVGAGIGVIAPITVIVSLPAMFAANKRVQDEFAIQRNIVDNQLVNKTLYQRRSHSGFLYFLLNSKEDSTMVAGISLSMQNIRSKKIISFVINID